MKVAFLFKGKVPVEKYICNLISQLPVDKIKGIRGDIESYVRAGNWGLPISSDYVSEIYNLFNPGSGILFKFSPHFEFKELFSLVSDIYIVQIDSMKRSIVLSLHTKLIKTEGYIGFVEVNLANNFHFHAFNAYGPIAKIENKKINFLYPTEDTEYQENVNNIIEQMNKHHSLHSIFISKKDMGLRFSLFDEYGDDLTNSNIDKALQVLNENWEFRAQEIFYKLQDINAHVVDELIQAINLLNKEVVSTADSSQIALSIRRCLEKFIDTVFPPRTNNEKKHHLDRYRLFIKELMSEKKEDEKKYYIDYLEIEVNDLYNRVDRIKKIGNGGIHGDWVVDVLAKTLLRTVLLLHDLLYEKSIKEPGGYYHYPSFE